MEENKKSSKTWLVVVLILVLVGALCISGYYIYTLNEKVTALEGDLTKAAAVIREINEKAAEEENIKEEIKETEDKDMLEVYGINDKFKEISKAAIKSVEALELKNGEYVENKIDISYDLDKDGTKEIITKKNGKVYLNDKVFYEDEGELSLRKLFIVDLDKNDSSSEIVLEIVGGTGAGEWLYFDIFKMVNGKINKINYESKYSEDEADSMYINNKGKFILLDEIQRNLTPLLTTEYFEYKNNKIITNKIKTDGLSSRKFVISKANEYECIMTKKEVSSADIDNSKLKEYKIKEDTKITILSYKDGVMKIKLSNGETRYIYSVQRLHFR